MMRPLTNVTCCVFDSDKLDQENRYSTKYYVNYEGIGISRTVKLRGVLKSLDEITDEERSRWKMSNTIDSLKMKDYYIIQKVLVILGAELHIISDLAKRDFHIVNNNYHLKSMGGRAFKPFEMNILNLAYANPDYSKL
jgi:hypothetical protein